MINKADLRLNTWVYWGEGTKIPILNNTPRVLIRSFLKLDEGRLEGIPLTAELLSKIVLKGYDAHAEIKTPASSWYFPYVREGDKPTSYFIINNRESEDNQMFAVTVRNPLGTEGVVNKVTYLHELQNMYYAITKQELEINEKIEL